MGRDKVGRGRNGKRAKWECYLGEMGKGEVGKGEMGRHLYIHITSLVLRSIQSPGSLNALYRVKATAKRNVFSSRLNFNISLHS
jgi:hypothetical protein